MSETKALSLRHTENQRRTYNDNGTPSNGLQGVSQMGGTYDEYRILDGLRGSKGLARTEVQARVRRTMQKFQA